MKGFGFNSWKALGIMSSSLPFCLEKFDSKLVVKKNDSIVNGYINALNSDSEYLKSITESTGSVARVNKRFKKTIEIISEAIS